MKKLKRYITSTLIILTISSKSNCVKAYDWAIPPQFYTYSNFSEGFANCGYYSYYIDYEGNTLYSYPESGPRYGSNFSYDLALGSLNPTGGGYKFYDKLGKSYDIDENIVPSTFSEGLSKFSIFLNDNVENCGFLNKDFNVFINPDYNYASDFSEGYSQIRKNDSPLFGYINRLGEMVIVPQFIDASNFSNGVAAVKSSNGLWGYIDYKGNYIIQPKYIDAMPFYDNYAIVSTDNRKGFIDISDNFIEVDTNIIYQNNFSEGVSVIEYSDKFGLINNKGEYVLKPEFEYLSNCNEGVIVGIKDNKYFLLDSSGNIIEEFKDAPLISDTNSIHYLNNSYENLLSAAIEVDGNIMWGYLKNPIALPSEWAKSEIQASFINGIVPHFIAYNYQNEITRKEFCVLIVKMIERTLDTTIPIENINIFEDTKDINISKLYYAGIINGTDNNNFAPNDFLTREEAARILMYTGIYMGVPLEKTDKYIYNDINEISDWAKEAVGILYHNNIMKGIEGDFLPKEIFTREQSIISVYRLYKKFKF